MGVKQYVNGKRRRERMEEKKAFEALSCAKEVVKVLERHHATVNDMERVLGIVKDMVLSSTLVHIE
jgi:hypothetical protein